MKSKQPHDGASSRAADTTPRRAYTRPELTIYGPLAKLTRGTASAGTEMGPTGTDMKNIMCL